MDGTGIAYGYSNHNKQLTTALENNGVVFDDNSDISLMLVPAGAYKPIEGKYNILYTMFEATDIPPSWVEPVNQADLIIVPCEHNRKVFKRFTKKPVEVCLEGTKPDMFTYKERKFEKPFTFLWFGASNQRKGYVHTIYAWTELKKHYPEIAKNCRLYMKTTQTETGSRIIGYENGMPIYKEMPAERIFQTDDVTVDTRKVSEEELVKIYHDAHCFLFPTMGEGFGLTLAEAMSTGLPCIYTPWSGPVDFISPKEGYPLKFKILPVYADFVPCGGDPDNNYKTFSASALIPDLMKRMVQVYSDYDTALIKGKRAAERIRKEITWNISARRLIDIIKHYTEAA
jgi:glycosyltransferase involved in cell wall biosynthesis